MKLWEILIVTTLLNVTISDEQSALLGVTSVAEFGVSPALLTDFVHVSIGTADVGRIVDLIEFIFVRRFRDRYRKIIGNSFEPFDASNEVVGAN